MTPEQIIARLARLKHLIRGMESATYQLARDMRREAIEEIEDLAGEIALGESNG